MVIHHPQTKEEAVALRYENGDSAYLAGGTDDLRLNGAADRETALIDINGLVESGITETGDGLVKIGALTTFQDMIDSPLIPEAVKSSCRFCASFAKRNSATVGGNIGLGRDDGYLIAVLAAMGVTMHVLSPEGECDMNVENYVLSKNRSLILHFLLDGKKKTWVKRFGLASTSHACLIAAVSDSKYVLTVKGSPLVSGDTPEIWKKVTYTSDITGSAEYKEYLAKTVFTLGRNGK
jgi:CO/xanthine dehydrogenase FAD-binding subunit